MNTTNRNAKNMRNIFRLVTATMDNWKMPITIVIDSDDMRGANDAERMTNAVKRMGRIIEAIRFMVGDQSCNHAKVYANADGTGKTLVYRNAGYYKNIGA
jgi:hypothetical protein